MVTVAGKRWSGSATLGRNDGTHSNQAGNKTLSSGFCLFAGMRSRSPALSSSLSGWKNRARCSGRDEATTACQRRETRGTETSSVRMSTPTRMASRSSAVDRTACAAEDMSAAARRGDRCQR